MSKYFIDTEIYFQNKKQPPRKVILTSIYVEPNGHSACCYDEDGNDYSIELNEIFDDGDNPIKDARNKLNMTQKEFAEFFDIPKRTIEDWERQISKPPKYVLSMLLEKVFSIVYGKGDDEDEVSNKRK